MNPHSAALEEEAEEMGFPGIVTVGACLNAAKKAADPSAQGVQIVREAHALFEGLEASERNDFVYSAMIMALGAAGMKEEAVRLFEEAADSLQPWCGAPIDAQPALDSEGGCGLWLCRPSPFVYGAAYRACPKAFACTLRLTFFQRNPFQTVQ